MADGRVHRSHHSEQRALLGARRRGAHKVIGHLKGPMHCLEREQQVEAPPRVVLPLSVLFDSADTSIDKVPRTCADVEKKCREQCNSDIQCSTCCVSCPDDPTDKCFVQPDQCTIHSDG